MTLEELPADIRQRVPRFEIRWKDQRYSDDPWRRRLVEAVGQLFAGRSSFFREYVTTIYPFVYYPGSYRGDETRVLRALRHERVHLLDQQAHPVWFPLSYVFVLPFVFTMRSHWELRAFAQNLIDVKEHHGYVPEGIALGLERLLTGRPYGWMDPFFGRRRVRQMAARVESGEISGPWPWPILTAGAPSSPRQAG